MIANGFFKGLFLIGGPLRFGIFIRSEKDGSEESSIDSRCVHDDRVFLVVPSIAQNGNDRIDAGRKLSESKILHRTSRHQRLLRITKDVGQGVHTDVEICDVHTHGLFSHGTLIRITRGLVVIRERDDGGAHSQNHCRMNFAMGVGGTVSVLSLKR